MTLENFNYRTDPLFLRNEFKSSNKYGIPDIPVSDFSEEDLKELRLLAFNKIKSDNGKHNKRIIHFFLYDYNFESVWKYPNRFIDSFSNYQGILTPDYSMYIEMPYAMQLYNVFRNRWCGAYYASKGIKVIPTVSWGKEDSFEFCFKGIPIGSIVAVSTYMFHESSHHKDQKEIFMNGYNKMLSEIKPSKIICYGEPFPEMQGDIIYIDYELSSWKHLDDDKNFKILLQKKSKSFIIIKNNGYVCKGGGSAFGGDWKPKDKNSERFKGTPDSVKDNHVSTKKGGYDTTTKYGKDGNATAERHHTDHGRPDMHSNPHDHSIDWSKGSPEMSSPQNYFDGNIPSFSDFLQGILDNIGGGIDKMNKSYDSENHSFDTLGEFKIYLSCGANIGFEYKNIEYGIEGHDDKYDIWIYNKGDIANNLSLEEVLDFELNGVKIRDLILDVEITERIM